MPKFKNHEKGSALILVIIFMALAAAVVPPMLSYMGTGLKTGIIYEENTKELYAAESGIEDALWTIMNDTPDDYPYSYQLEEYINEKDVIVEIEDLGMVFKITSTGTSDNNSGAVVECYAMYPITMYDLAAASLDGDLTITGNTEIDSSPDLEQADIYANGDIVLDGKVKAYGDGTAVGDINMSGQSEITGNVTEHSPPLIFEEIDTSKYLEEADEGFPVHHDLSITTSCTLGPTHIHGDLDISSTSNVTLAGTVWVDGSLTMSGSSHVEGAGTIVAVEDMTITGGGELQPDDLPSFISTTGSITTTGNQRVYAVLYAPNGVATISGTSGIYGAVTGKSVIIETSSTLTYGLELAGRSSRGDLKIVSYLIR